MPRPNAILDSRAHQNGGKQLPLFRPEAVVHQQQKSYGEIVLIRPLSLTLLTWLAIAIVGLALAFLLLGHYTENIRFSGSLLAPSGDSAYSHGNGLHAELYVPERRLSLVAPGTAVLLRCPACNPQFAVRTGTVQSIAATSSIPQTAGTAAANTSEPMFAVTVSLPSEAAHFARLNPSSQSGTPVEAVIPLGRKPLIKWLFERSGS